MSQVLLKGIDKGTIFDNATRNYLHHEDVYISIYVELHCVLWRHMASQSLDKVGSSDGLLPDGTEPLRAITWTNVDFSVGSCAIRVKATTLEIIMKVITTTHWKLTI